MLMVDFIKLYPLTHYHGSGWHGPLEDHVPLQTEGFPLICDVLSECDVAPWSQW